VVSLHWHRGEPRGTVQPAAPIPAGIAASLAGAAVGISEGTPL
jgi:hypothetical protein